MTGLCLQSGLPSCPEHTEPSSEIHPPSLAASLTSVVAIAAGLLDDDVGEDFDKNSYTSILGTELTEPEVSQSFLPGVIF